MISALLLILSGCNLSNPARLAGIYYQDHRHWSGYSVITLREDYRFSCLMFLDVGGKAEEEGTWECRADTLILTKFEEEKKPSTFIERGTLDSLNDKCKVTIYEGKDSVLGISCLRVIYANGDTIFSVSKSGIFFLDPKPIHAIQPVSFSEQDTIYHVNNPKVKEIDVYFRIYDEPLLTTNRCWIIKRRAILPCGAKNSKVHRYARH